MCGIAGYVGNAEPGVLQSMSAAIAHRGPDDQGDFVGEGFGLAHRRLSIIDLAGGHQPMASTDGSLLVYNGEIYNFLELRRELEQLGCHFATRSDTEVLLHACHAWGEESLDRLRGMFAFAWWNAADRQLLLARDRAGIKPLYYARHRGVFYFASEIKALLAVPGMPRRLNRQALPLYLTFRYTPGEQTMFEGIYKLLPGHRMTVDLKGQIGTNRYWQLNFEPDEGPSESAWRERFWGTFSEAVRMRMISDVPLGAYLSGGLDSSLIVAAMSAASDRSVETFSVGFQAAKYDESAYAALVAGQFGCRHHRLSAEEEAGDLLDRVVYHLDEPLADLATIPTYLMARETKPHVTVVLSGEGADELLAGYPKYRAVLWGRRLSAWLPPPVFRAGRHLAGTIALQRALASMGERESAAAYLQLASVFSGEEMSQLLIDPDMASGPGPHQVVSKYLNPGLDGLSQLLNLDFHTWLPDDLLLKNDKMTMAHGVEARVPYLDHHLVELCARMPSRYKLRWNQEKVLLRKVMAGRLPDRIVRRRKTGFTVPLAEWLKGPLGEQVRDLFAPQTVREQGLFRSDYIAALAGKPLNDAYYRRQFWTVASLGLWQKRFGVEF